MNVYCYPHLKNANDLHCVQQNIVWTGILQYTCVKHIGSSPHVALGSMEIACIRKQYLLKFLTIS
jgi:hypothetical protein